MYQKDFSRMRYPAFAARVSAPVEAGEVKVSEIARFLEVSTNAVRKYMAGETLPAPDKLLKLSKLLDVPVRELLPDLETSHEIADRPERVRTPSAVMWAKSGLLGLINDDSRVKALNLGLGGTPGAPGLPGLLATVSEPNSLKMRRAAIVADLTDMLERYRNVDDLREAYIRCVKVLGDHWDAVKPPPPPAPPSE